MWLEARTEETCNLGVLSRTQCLRGTQASPDAQSTGRGAGSCWMSRSLPGEARCGERHPSLRAVGSDLDCLLKSLGSLEKYECLGPLSRETWISYVFDVSGVWKLQNDPSGVSCTVKVKKHSSRQRRLYREKLMHNMTCLCHVRGDF